MSNEESPTKKRRLHSTLPPLENFPVDFEEIETKVVKKIKKAFSTFDKADADMARESTFPYLTSDDFATVQLYKDVYATSQVIYAESLLHEAILNTQTLNECLRALDLAILRGGIEKWGDVCKLVAIRAENLLYACNKSAQRQLSSSIEPRDSITTTTDHPPQYLQHDPNSYEIARVDANSLTWIEFRDTYMLSSPSPTPVIITNAMTSWPALQLWQDISYIKDKAAGRLVPVEIYSEKDSTQTYLSDSWEQRVMSLGEFIETHIEPDDTGADKRKERGYLAQYQLFDQIPCLREDIQVPSYCNALTPEDILCPHSEFAGDTRTAEDALISAWFGPAGTVSPLHNDPYHNLLAQVVGRKYLRLYDMKFTGNLYPRDGFQCNNSNVDIDDVNHEKYPLFSTTPSFQCILESGEMLYIPRHFWHYVRSLDVSFSVSFWFGSKMGLVKNEISGEYEAVYS